MEANIALLQCYRKVNFEDYKKMAGASQENLCSNHKDKIKNILAEDSMTMTRLVSERVEILTKMDPKKLKN